VKLVYIHGASATGESFNYIREHIIGDDLVLNYNSANGFDHNLKVMLEELKDINQIFFIAHSLGGIYALHLSKHSLRRGRNSRFCQIFFAF